jgi:hypothetical protein
MPNNVNVDYVAQGGHSAGAGVFLNKLSANTLRPYIGDDGNVYITVFKGGDRKNPKNYAAKKVQVNATLRRDEWKELDEVLLGIAETRIDGVQDLIDNGLTYTIGNGMGSTVLEYHDVSDALAATVSMDGVSRGKSDRPVYTTNYLPLPIIHADWDLNQRVLEASRTLGNPLDTTLAERAGRKVLEERENMLFASQTYTYGGGTIYSYLNHPDRNTLAIGTNWDDGAKTPAQIKDDVLAMKQAAINAKHYGPYMLYIPTAYETVLDDDYDATTPGKTIRARLMEIERIQGIKVIDTLPANNVVLVQMTSDVVRLVTGLPLQPVEWAVEGGLITHFKVMTIQVPQIRSDQTGNSGIVHLS